MSYTTEGDVVAGKPSKGTRKDKRLKRNKRKSKSKVSKPQKSRGRGYALQGYRPIPVEWRHGG